MMPIPANPTNASIQPQSLYDAWADLAWRAMLTEVNLSPKPGLVDRLNCGAHKDMALADFHRSAEAIRHWLPRFMEYGASCTRLPPESVLAGLRPLGMACEAAMFRATAGVNTHKGSIFSLGLLCAAIGRLYQLRQPIAAETLCATAADFCRGLTTRELRQNNLQLTAGQRLYQQLINRRRAAKRKRAIRWSSATRYRTTAHCWRRGAIRNWRCLIPYCC